MKRLWIAVCLLLALLGGTLLNAWYSQRLTGSLAQSLEQAQALAQEDRWDQAARITDAAYQRWLDSHFYLHIFMRHSDTDQILRAFQCVRQYLDLEEMDQYAAANADLITQLELLSEMEQTTLVNVL